MARLLVITFLFCLMSTVSVLFAHTTLNEETMEYIKNIEKQILTLTTRTNEHQEEMANQNTQIAQQNTKFAEQNTQIAKQDTKFAIINRRFAELDCSAEQKLTFMEQKTMIFKQAAQISDLHTIIEQLNKSCAEEIANHKKEPHLVDGGCGTWSNYSACSVTCGKGTQTRTRQCNNLTPIRVGTYLHLNPTTDNTETSSCNTGICPVDGGWGTWSNYSACSVKCGGGTRTRTRQCNNPTQIGAGANCPNPTKDNTETSSCNTAICPGNIALNKTAVQWSTLRDDTADRAIDGNNSTYAWTGDSYTTAWWCVDLHKEYSISTINMITRAKMDTFEVRLSSTGSCNQSGFNSANRCYTEPGVRKDWYAVNGCNDGRQMSGRYVFIGRRKSLVMAEVEIYSN